MHFEVFFDVETKKLFSDVQGFDPKDLGVSIVSVYSRGVDVNPSGYGEQNRLTEGRKILSEVEGKMQSFWEKDISNMWPIFQKADRVIGFNSLGFDVPALSPYTNFPLNKLPHFDIMQKVKEAYGKRISLDAIAKETLDREKLETGLEAVFLWQKGDRQSLKRLKRYSQDDVEITKEIYDYALDKGYLLFKDKWNTLRRVEVDFTYPKEKDKQPGLFS